MSYRTVYQLDPTGFFVAEERAHESPLEPGLFLVPAYCVVAPPPALGEGERARWVEGIWEIVPPDPPPAPEEDLPRTRDELLSALAMLRAAQEAAGVEMDGQTFASDLVAAVNVETTVAFMEAAGHSTVRWKAWAGWADLSHPQLGELRLLIGAHREHCFAAEEAAAADVTAGEVTTFAQAKAAFSARFEEI